MPKGDTLFKDPILCDEDAWARDHVEIRKIQHHGPSAEYEELSIPPGWLTHIQADRWVRLILQEREGRIIIEPALKPKP